jgi:hypothetical protein
MVSDRLLAAVAAAKLDRELAEGARQSANRALAWRARVLLAPRAREQLGEQLRRIVRDAHTRTRPGLRMPINRERVLAAQDDLQLLASRLQSPTQVDVRGVAKARLLLTDGAGPIFYARNKSDLAALARDATCALR